MIHKKRIITLLLSILMIFSMTLSVCAEGANESIPTSGSITIHKYELADDAALGDAATGREITTDLTNVKQALKGVQFKITPVKEKTEDSEDTVLYTYTSGNDKVEYVANGESETATTNESGLIEWKNLSLGYYLIEEIDNPIVSKKSDPFIVSIPMRVLKEDSTSEYEELYNVHVYPKNTVDWDPTVEKSVNGGIYSGIGQDEPANFEIKVQIPADIASCKNFTITDTIDSRLTAPDVDKIEVKQLTKASSDDEKDISEDLNSAYYSKIIETSVKDEKTIKTIKITLTDEGLKNIKGGSYLVISYTCQLSAEGLTLDNAGQAIPNTAQLTYTNSLGYDREYETKDPVEVHTTAIRLNKVDGSSEEKLKGAEFAIYRDAKCENPVKDADGNNMTATSNSDGSVVFSGLSYGGSGSEALPASDASTTYYIKETKAPAGGYIREDNVITVTADKDSASDDAVYTVKNYTEITLPGTGLTGSNMIWIGLGIIVIASAVIIYTLKKRNHEA